MPPRYFSGFSQLHRIFIALKEPQNIEQGMSKEERKDSKHFFFRNSDSKHFFFRNSLLDIRYSL